MDTKHEYPTNIQLRTTKLVLMKLKKINFPFINIWKEFTNTKQKADLKTPNNLNPPPPTLW